MSVTDVCRLCLTKDNLVWIFDKRFNSSESMKDVIYITTGVEIHIKDIISQKICQKCCQVTIKMFEFRRTSLKNDKQLREECKKYLKENNLRIPNTEVIIKSDIKCKNEVKIEPKSEVSKPVFKIHPSVRDLFRVHPQIKLPTVCLSSHITPFVSMPMDEVENYFKIRKLDFNLHTKLALKSGNKVATKKTSAAAKPKPLICPASNNPVAPKIVPSKSENKDNVIGPLKIKVPVSKSVENKDNVIGPLKIKVHESKSVSKTNDKCSNIKFTDLASHSKTKDNVNIANVNIPSKSVVKTNDIIDNENIKSIKDMPSEKPPTNRKRKLSETDEASKKEKLRKPNLIESLGLTPKPNVSASTSFTESPLLSYVANMSVPLHICDICNSVQYSAKDLRKHQNKHLRCQFCKTKFRTLETKSKHIETTCIIKNTMNNLPDVQLNKIEYNVAVRRKYPEAFIDFAPLKNMSDEKENSVNIKNSEVTTSKDTSSPSNNLDKTNLKIAQKPKGAENEVEIIEITSDDEDSSTTVSGAIDKLNTLVLNVGQGTSKSNSDGKPVLTSQTPKSSKTTALPTPDSLAPIPENIVYNTVSIVKPDIRIKNSTVLESIDPKLTDVKILKELLTRYKPLQLSAEKMVQTVLPTNQSISINRSELTSELKNLKQQLHVYKIPVFIKNGTYKVCYNYRTDTKPPKKLCLWNDLTPIDIKANVRVPTSTNNERQVVSEKSNSQETNKNTFLSSTATYNLPGFQSGSNANPVASGETNNHVMNNNSSLPATTSYNNCSTVQEINKNTFLSSTATYNLPGFQSGNNANPVVSGETNNHVTNNNSSLPATTYNNCSTVQETNKNTLLSSTATYNLPGFQSGNNANPVVSGETNNHVTNNNSSLPSTTYNNFSTVQSLPSQTIAPAPRFVCVNTTSAFNVTPTTNIIDMTPHLNTVLQSENTTPVTETVISPPVPATSNLEVPVSNTTVPIGMIRVRNVWELS